MASLRLFLRSSTGPNRALEPQSLGGVCDPVRIAEGPTHHFGFSILDFELRTEATRVSLPEAPARGEGFLVDSLHEGERPGPRTLWYLGNVDGPRCHANQVVPATGLVDDAITTARQKGIVDQAGKPDLLPCRGNGFPAIRRRLTHGRVRYNTDRQERSRVKGSRPRRSEITRTVDAPCALSCSWDRHTQIPRIPASRAPIMSCSQESPT